MSYLIFKLRQIAWQIRYQWFCNHTFKSSYISLNSYSIGVTKHQCTKCGWEYIK